MIPGYNNIMEKNYDPITDKAVYISTQTQYLRKCTQTENKRQYK